MTPDTIQDRLKETVYGFCLSQCVYVAAELGIADCLREGPKSCAELAELTGSHTGALRRILRSLASIGIFREDEDGCFMLTPLAGILRTETEGSMRGEVLHMLHPSSWAAWGELLHSVRTGEAAFPRIFGEDAWSYRSRHPEISTIFDTMATAMSKREADSILPHLDLSNVGQIVDVGGGKGELIVNLLLHQANLHGILFDQPHVVAGADEILQAAGVADRCRTEPGDFFIEVPKDGDMYLLKSVIHNWNDEAALAILRNCRKAMSSDARIVLVELILDPARPTAGNLKDLRMLVIHGGQERTWAEFGALLDASGFRLSNIVTTASGISLLEGIPTRSAGV